MKFPAFFFFLVILFQLQSQNLLSTKTGIQVVETGTDTLKSPFAGGLNFVQLSEIDFNGDSLMDLFVFDRATDCVKTFVYDKNAQTYIYAPQYEQYFPADMHYWALLRDFNNDGKQDLFTGISGGIRAYKNVGVAGGVPQFVLYDSLIYSSYSGYSSALYVSPLNLPALDDIDGDGDLDVLTFDLGGSFVEFHQNMSMERYGIPDSLIFVWDQKGGKGCWGNFDASGYRNVVQLNQGCQGNHRESGIEHHSGSALTTIELGETQVRDLLISCVSTNNIDYLHNAGTRQHSDIDSQDTLFPHGSKAVFIYGFPATFAVDINHDGKKDVVASPNLSYAASDYNGIWYYERTSSDTNNAFTLIQQNFLQDQMIDVGTGANPVLFDYDGDGRMDLLVANYGAYNNGNYTSSIALYKNELVQGRTRLTLITKDFANLSSYGLENIYPAFADLDGDGDEDMVIGESQGNLYYFTNTAGKGNPAVFQLTTPTYFSINVGQFSTPQLVDVDGDGLIDLLIGKQSGSISYYRNAGTPAKADFELVTNTFGKVTVRTDNYVTGFSVPFLFNNAGQKALLVGAQSGDLYLYGNLQDSVFSRIRSYKQDIRENSNVAASLGDIDGDGQAELLVGTELGGVKIYNTQKSFSMISDIRTLSLNPILSIFPNPVKDILCVRMDTNTSPVLFQAFDSFGRLVFTKHFTGQSIDIPVEGLSQGVYVAKITTDKGQSACRFVVIH